METKRTGLLVALAVAMFSAGCRVPPPGTPVRTAIDCTAEAIQANWPGALGPVNTCLAGASGATSCLLGLIRPAAGITEDLIACIVRDQGGKFAHAAQANPEDTRSARAAGNARSFIAERGYTFAVE